MKNTAQQIHIGIDWGFENEVCEACGGTGELYAPAENRGGELVGPDTRPCPNCQFNKEDDGE